MASPIECDGPDVAGRSSNAEQEEPTLRVSIIVCTRQRADMLRDALTALVEDGSTVERELLVVDNASTDHTPEVVRAVAARSPFSVRYVREPLLGVSNARNRGVEASRGRILLFTDDDVLVEPSWVDQMVAPFDDPAVGAVGGRVLPQWPAPPPAWLHGPHADLITMVDRGEEPRMYDRDKVPSGASMAIRVTALGGVARPFDPRLGRTGSDSMAGEEDAVLFGLHDSGWALSYTPKALAWHRITPERMTWPALARQHFGSGVARARVDRMRPDAELDGVPIRGARFARAIGRAVARNARRPAPVDPTDAGVRLDAYRRLGYAAESLLGTAPRFARWVERRLQPFQRGT